LPKPRPRPIGKRFPWFSGGTSVVVVVVVGSVVVVVDVDVLVVVLVVDVEVLVVLVDVDVVLVDVVLVVVVVVVAPSAKTPWLVELALEGSSVMSPATSSCGSPK
jgi:hypothetical protein